MSSDSNSGISDAFLHLADLFPLVLALFAVLLSGPAVAQHLLNPSTGERVSHYAAQALRWYQFPNSKLLDALPPESFTQPIRRIVGPKAIVSAWSGGAYDSKRDRLMVFGGGHADYCGNEWLAFDLKKGSWSILSGPSDLAAYDDQSGRTPDGNPASRHTYNGLEYIPTTDELLVHGGSLCNGAGSADDRWWVGDPETGGWTFQGGEGTWKLGYSLAWDPLTQQVYEYRKANFYAYDPATDRWRQLTRKYGDLGRWGLTGAIDPSRRQFILVGQNSAYRFGLENAEMTEITFTGPADFKAVIAPGFEFVPGHDSFFAWSGDGKLYQIDADTLEVKALPTAEAPPAAQANGTYGRFRYSEAFDGFVLVNSAEANVYFLPLPESTADQR